MKNRFFTLLRHGWPITAIEMLVAAVVLVALIVTLAPLLAHNVGTTRTDRAQLEVKLIATALTDFYADLGQWPTGPRRTGSDAIHLLLSGSPENPGKVPHRGEWSAMAHLGHLDFLANHLITNTPVGGPYPIVGQHAWRGPDLSAAPLDPWGLPYRVNIAVMLPGSSDRHALALSAGPNGVVETGWSHSPAGDDIGALLPAHRES